MRSRQGASRRATPSNRRPRRVTTAWPREASCIQRESVDFYNEDEGEGDNERAGGIDFYPEVLRLLQSYSTFNPHAGFRLSRDGTETVVSDPTLIDWQKWQPHWPTSPHWYTADDIKRLIGAYITNGDGQKTVREFVSEFRGLSGTAKQKKVVSSSGLSGQCLNDLVRDGAIDAVLVEQMLKEMCAESHPVKANKLGIVGEETLSKRMVEFDGVVGNVRYSRKVSESPSRPKIVEMALGFREDDKGGKRVRFGLNFSPAIGIPRAAWPTWLQQAMVDSYDPICLTIHASCPRFEFTNRGKSMLGGLHQ